MTVKLSDYSDDDLIEEIKQRGIEVRVHINEVDLTVFMGDEELGVINAKKRPMPDIPTSN